MIFSRGKLQKLTPSLALPLKRDGEVPSTRDGGEFIKKRRGSPDCLSFQYKNVFINLEMVVYTQCKSAENIV
jgi:hypothetical protein